MDLLPVPRMVTRHGNDGIAVNEALRSALDRAQDEGVSHGPIQLQLSERALEATGAPDGPIAEQGYVLAIATESVTLTARAEAGLFYGLMTLRQLIDPNEQDATLPRLTIVDWPDLQWRGLQLDIARRMVYRHEHVKDIIRQMAALKLNMLHLYLEGSFAFPSLPNLSHPPDTMTADQARELSAFARAHHVTLVPQVNCLGHMRQILDDDAYAPLREDPEDGYLICPSHPDALPLVCGLVDDLADAFDTPFIHIGMDEAGKLGACPRCRERVERDGHAGGLLADHINGIAGHLRDRHRRTMIWGDMLLDKMHFPGTHAANGGITGWGSRNMTCKALDLLDRDIIVCDWQYAYFMPEQFVALRQAGFDIMPAYDTDERVCPWGPVRGLDFHARAMADAAKQNGALGAYATTWSMYMGEYFHNRWLDYAKTAEALWSTRSADPAELANRFSRVFFGLDEPLLHSIDQAMKIDVLPSSMRLVPNVMKEGDPWALLRAPQGAAEPVRPLGNPSELIGMKSACLTQCRRAADTALRRGRLLSCLDIPFRVDVFAVRCFHLRDSLRTVYAYAAQHPGDTQVQQWCQEAVITGLSGLRADAETLRERFVDVYAEFGNNAGDIQRADETISEITAMLDKFSALDGLPPLDQWCPEPLRG